MSRRRRARDGEPFRLGGSDVWYADWYDAEKRKWLRRSTGVRTLRSARTVARRWLEEGEQVQTGAAPATIQDQHRTLADHVADFMSERARDPQHFTAKHMRELRRRLERLAVAAGWTELPEITEQGFLLALAKIEEADETQGAPGAGGAGGAGFSPATKNAYRAALRAFTRWSHQTGRLRTDPLAKLRKWAVRGYRTFHRRPFTRHEMATLVVRTRARAGTLEGMTGPDRAMLYLVAVATGFRLAELGSLTRRSFKLDAEPPHVVLAASSSKDGKPHEQTLVPRGLPELSFVVDELRRWLEGRPMDARCWPVEETAGRMIRTDLRAAGIAIEAAPGERVDFHCLRGTLGRWLADAGVPMAMAQRILRHSDPKLTADHYTHLGIAELSRQRGESDGDLRSMAAPGTSDGQQPEAAGGSGGDCANLAQRGTSADSEGHANAPTPATAEGVEGSGMDRETQAEAHSETSADIEEGAGTANASSRIRTLNPLIKSRQGADCDSAENTGDDTSDDGDPAQFLRKHTPHPLSGVKGRELDQEGPRTHARDRADAGVEPDLATAIRRVEALAAMAMPTAPAGGGR